MTSQVPQKKSGRLMRQLKSPKLWVSLIATALASLAVGLYLEYRADEKLEEENAHVARQLKIEIVRRSAQFLTYLDKIKQSGDVGGFAKLIKATGSAEDGTYPMSYFSEYADFDLTSLLLKLRLVSTNNCFGDKMLETAALSTVEIRDIIDSDTSGGTPESKLDTWIGVATNKIKLVLLVKFLDAKNEFSPPPDSGLSPELLDNIYSIKRAECG